MFFLFNFIFYLFSVISANDRQRLNIWTTSVQITEKILETLKQVEDKMNFLCQIRKPRLSDIELIAIDLTSEYMGFDSDFFVNIKITLNRKVKIH